MTPTMGKQVLRGVAGLLLIAVAAMVFRAHYALSFGLVLLAAVPLKGCPTCWLVNTCEIARHDKKRAADSAAEVKAAAPSGDA